MATLTATGVTLAEWAKRIDPDGNIAMIVEILNETNAVLDDWVFKEGNLPTGHRSTIRTGLPVPTWRKMYGGVQPSKSKTAQITDTCGMLEAFAEVDCALADLNGNTAAFRLSEDRAHIEGMSQEAAATLFYGNQGTEPEAFHGLSPRYNSLSAENALNIVVDDNPGNDDGGSASIWLIVWGENIHGIFPKGSTAGLKSEDLGKIRIEDASDGSNTGRMMAYSSHYRWDLGLTVRDWRYAVRAPNIDVSELTGNVATSEANLIDLMARMQERVPNLSAGKATYYMNRQLKELLRLQIKSAVTSSTLTMDMVGGKHVERFDGIKVGRCDALLSNEGLVT